MTKNIFTTIALFTVCFFVQAQNPLLADVTISPLGNICSEGEIVSLTANYTPIYNTTDYTVSNIPYASDFPFTGGTTLNASADDRWSPVVTLPFNFCFYGNFYNKILVGSNGVVTFDINNNQALGACPWQYFGSIPDSNFPIRNAIYGVYQDTDITNPPVVNPLVQNINYYLLDTGANAAPNRVFVINFNELPAFYCNTSVALQTSQIKLYETTNIIDIKIQNRTSCTTWNNGRGLIGIQNQTGTLATVPPGRNTGTWSTTNEAWRFIPNGNEVQTNLSWSRNGVLLQTNANPLVVIPQSGDVYQATVAFANCDGISTVVGDVIDFKTLFVTQPAFANPTDILVCNTGSNFYTTDLSVNSANLLNGLDPVNYEIRYYESLQDAQTISPNTITSLTSYQFTDSQTIYMSIEGVLTGCNYIRQFQVMALPVVLAPNGAVTQLFSVGQTLANLVVVGENIIWYDAAVFGTVLSPATLLQNGFTYYATQSINGCESRNALSNRLAVTVNLILDTTNFTNARVSVFPNPVSAILSVSATATIKSLTFFNTIGQKVLVAYPNQKDATIDVSKLESGVYFINMNTETGSQIVQIVKN